MKTDNSSEMFPVVDEQGNIIGAATRGECHGGAKLLHPVVHLHVFDAEGRIFLQKRPVWKDIQPGKWDTAVGGHVDLGENMMQALFREAKEELGLSDFKPEFIKSYVFESDRERELVCAFKTTTDETPLPTEELDGGSFFTRNEILESIGKDIFTPNFEKEWQSLFGDILNPLNL